MIELHNFTRVYGDLTAVDQLNLKIETGELFGFIGPNGAGKSTTIRFLATLLKATSGEGTVNGFSVTRDPLNVRRSVGYMPDAFGVYDGMRVWEFLDFFAVAYRIGKLRRAIKAPIEAFNEARNGLIKKYGKNDPETGKPSVKLGTKEYTQFEDEMKVLGDEDVEFDSVELKLSELEAPGDAEGEDAKPWLTGKILGDLHWLIKEG